MPLLFLTLATNSLAVKDPGKITRVTINSSPEESFSFLGIVSAEPDYKLTHLLNKKLGIALSHSPDEVLPDSNNVNVAFSKFTSPDKKFVLLSNKSGQSLIVRKLKKIDFLFLTAHDPTESLINVAEILRKIAGVTAVFIINSNEVKDKNLEIIRHLTE